MNWVFLAIKIYPVYSCVIENPFGDFPHIFILDNKITRSTEAVTDEGTVAFLFVRGMLVELRGNSSGYFFG